LKYIYLILITGLSLLLTGCLEGTKTPVYQDVEGAVVATSGAGIAGANIHIRNNFDPGGFSQQPSAEEFTIGFEAPVDTTYTMNLYRPGAANPFATFFNDTLSPGPQEITIPDSLLSNGILEYEIITGSEFLYSSLFLVNKPDTALIGTTPLTISDSNGEFILESDYLALGRPFQNSGGGFEITDSLEIIVITQDSVITKQRLKVEPNQANFFEVTID
jgi:hypothetical protein